MVESFLINNFRITRALECFVKKRTLSSRENHAPIYRPHGALGGLAPADVNYANGGRLLTEQVKNVEKADRLSKKIFRPFKFNIGDYVHRAVKVSPFHKSYRGNYREEVLLIRKKWRQSSRWDINLYSLQDLTGKEILGRIYEPQLLKVHYDPDDRKIKKIISKRKTGNFVELEDYPSGHRKKHTRN